MNLKSISILSHSLALGAALVLGGCFSVNSDIEIGDGVTVERSLNTVNGRVTVGRDTTVKGNVRTVNGAVEIGADSVVGEVQTVNGKIELGDGVRADSVEAVNGSVELGEGVEVEDQVETVNGRVVIGGDSIIGGRVESVNGQIRLVGATAGSLRNRRGGMLLEAGSRVLGELRVTKAAQRRAQRSGIGGDTRRLRGDRPAGLRAPGPASNPRKRRGRRNPGGGAGIFQRLTAICRTSTGARIPSACETGSVVPLALVFDPAAATGLIRIAVGARDKAAPRLPLVIALDPYNITALNGDTGGIFQRVPDLHRHAFGRAYRESLPLAVDILIAQ